MLGQAIQYVGIYLPLNLIYIQLKKMLVGLIDTKDIDNSGSFVQRQKRLAIYHVKKFVKDSQ